MGKNQVNEDDSFGAESSDSEEFLEEKATKEVAEKTKTPQGHGNLSALMHRGTTMRPRAGNDVLAVTEMFSKKPQK